MKELKMNKRHPYMTKEFWVKKQNDFKPDPFFTDNGNQLVKSLIDKFVNEAVTKENLIQ